MSRSLKYPTIVGEKWQIKSKLKTNWDFDDILSTIVATSCG